MVTCIIPFLNERERIGKVVYELVQAKNIKKIIAVDGGSTDGGWESIANNQKLKLIRLEKNIGKTGTVSTALKSVDSEFVLLFDADLENVNHQEIDKILEKIINDRTIDMILFDRITPKLITKINRMELIFTGERVLKMLDLIKILETNPVGFQLETAINTYMIKNRKKVFWARTTNSNLPKTKKFGSIVGQINNFKMFVEVFRYNPFSYLYQLLFFARREIPV